MRESVSIQFKNGDEISAALYSSFYRELLEKEAKCHAVWVKTYLLENGIPLEKVDPGAVMVSFFSVYINKKKNDQRRFFSWQGWDMLGLL